MPTRVEDESRFEATPTTFRERRQEKVVIKVAETVKPAVPLKVRKAAVGRPVAQNFRFVPMFNPDIAKLVKSVSWDCVKKNLHVTIQENNTFSVYNWFSSITHRTMENARSAFSDFERDSILLTFCDSQKNSVAKFKFKRVTLNRHDTALDEPPSYGISDTEPPPLYHSITLSYSEVEQLPVAETVSTLTPGELPIDPILEANEIADEEWTVLEIE